MENYKFKNLRTYSSDEWMVNSTKKYRKVFDQAELMYVRCELSFHNKLFDRQDWSCAVTLKCFVYENDKKKELCSLDSTVEVKMTEPIMFVRDGWGNAEEGAYWTVGDYFWEAYLDGELVGDAKFMINAVGKVTEQKNPYFSIEPMRLHVGDYNAYQKTTRHYLNEIIAESTQYVWVEAKLKNKVSEDWYYELFFNFFDEANQLKGQVIREGYIEKDKTNFSYTFDVGWGNDVVGSWKPKKYKVELVFMDTLVGSVEFVSKSKTETEVPQNISPVPERSPVLSKFRKILGLNKE